MQETEPNASGTLRPAMLAGGKRWRSSLRPSAALDELKDQFRRFRTGHHPADQCRRYRRHHFGAEFVNLAEGETGIETLSHSVRVRLEHRRCFRDDDTDRLAGVATNQQEVRHD